MMEGSRVTVLEAMDFLLGEAPALGVGKPLEGYKSLSYQLSATPASAS